MKGASEKYYMLDVLGVVSFSSSVCERLCGRAPYREPYNLRICAQKVLTLGAREALALGPTHGGQAMTALRVAAARP